MPSVQYVIDSICASVTGECVYKMIEALLSQGQCTIDEVLPMIQTKDRSLDLESARMIVRAAIDDMAQRGVLRIAGENIHSANQIR